MFVNRIAMTGPGLVSHPSFKKSPKDSFHTDQEIPRIHVHCHLAVPLDPALNIKNTLKIIASSTTVIYLLSCQTEDSKSDQQLT